MPIGIFQLCHRSVGMQLLSWRKAKAKFFPCHTSSMDLLFLHPIQAVLYINLHLVIEILCIYNIMPFEVVHKTNYFF